VAARDLDHLAAHRRRAREREPAQRLIDPSPPAASAAASAAQASIAAVLADQRQDERVTLAEHQELELGAGGDTAGSRRA